MITVLNKEAKKSNRVQTSQEQISLYGHGKLLLTSEYFVLDGAKALSIPTHFGQHMRVKKLSGESNTLYWIALNHLKQPWLNLAFDKTDFACINFDSKEAATLTQLLTQARTLNVDFLTDDGDVAVETYLEFPNSWGLGSSSTLVYCLSQWAKVDGITLLKKTIGGSGYDVACAGSDTPILYHIENEKPQWEQVSFDPPFRDQIYFAYTGQKALSSKGISYYKEKAKRKEDTVRWLNILTESMLQCQSIKKMDQIIHEHESIVSEQLELPKVKDQLFPDYWGEVKSLGAWGGDFVMLTNTQSEEELLSYLRGKDIGVVIGFDKMIFQ
jgi:mevalonate kinase